MNVLFKESSKSAIDFEDSLFLISDIKKPVVLVGLGPHAKRIYMHYFNKYSFLPKLIIELESKKEQVQEYLYKNNFIIKTFYIPDVYCNTEELPESYKSKLIKVIDKLKVTHAIISTEPKAHFAYLKFFLENRIHTLTDKPITSPINVSTQLKMAKKIEEDYECLVSLYNKAREEGVNCTVQCQRRWHNGYLYIRELLKECIEQYGIPITHIDIYHSDGMWNMPGEFISRENHPYKYGYGKLFHSGYHFIDLMCWFIDLNNALNTKKINNAELYAAITRPDDFMGIINNQDYERIFGTDKYNEIFNNFNSYNFDEFGEIDFYSLIQFKKGNNVITSCNLNLLQNGFSRRSWTDLPQDTYKSNGRVRHERINIQVGPLMNIQVHSYQSKEIKDRNKDICNEIGAVEHFDIYIFKNIDILGGKPFEKITIEDLMHNNK